MFLNRLLFFILLLITSLQAEQKNFTVSFVPDYIPFTYVEEGKTQGLLIDYWNLWAKKNNYEVKFVNGVLWKDAIDMVKKGKVDFFSGVLSKKEGIKSSKIPYEINTSLFTHKEDNSDNFDKKAPYVIAIITDTYKETIKKYFPNSHILVYKNYKSVFKDFISKKIDLVYDDKIALELFAIKNNYFHLIRSTDLLNKTSDLKTIAKTQELINIFNQGMKNISKKEVLSIKNKWIIEKGFSSKKQKYEFTKKEKDFIKNHIIKISQSEDWKPLSFRQNDEASGISYDFWKLIVKETGLKSEFTFFKNFTAQLNSIKNKSQDIILTVGKIKEKEEYALFSKVYYNCPISIATLKDENFIENTQQILDKKIAIRKNSTAHDVLKRHYPNIKFTFVSDVEEGLKSVLHKKVYAFIDVRSVLLYNINSLSLNNLKITGNTRFNFPLAIMINKDYPILKSIIDKAIMNLDKQELHNIILKWNNIQFEEKYNYKNIALMAIIFSIIIILILYKEFQTSKENKKLENLVNKRTKELRDLNLSLEQKIEEKTKELNELNYILDEAQKVANLGSFQFNIKENFMIFSEQLFEMLKIKKEKSKITFDLALSYVHEKDKERVFQTFINMLKTKEEVSIRFKILVEDKIKYTQLNARITKFDDKNNPLICIGTLFDITNIKKLEEETRKKDNILAQQAKMAAMGEMLENIAHQWRQPLSIISTATTGLHLQFDFNNHVSKASILDVINTVTQQAQYLSKTIDDFSNFFSPHRVKTNFKINIPIERVMLLIKQKIEKKQVKIIKNIEDISIFSYENELIQVLLNIFNNAIDVFKYNSDNYLFVNAKMQNEKLLIEILDNAGGVNKNIINRIFEPYFTTKHKSQGTGIGLYMSNEIVTKHLDGSLSVRNKLYTYNGDKYKGACFTIKMDMLSSPSATIKSKDKV